VYKVNNGPTWTETKIARLRELSMEGVSTSEIGRRLGVSKNAVVGKSHRLGLPARPSPIMRDGRPRPTRVPPGALANDTSRPSLPSATGANLHTGRA
jgi:GcrA cell cycle regulator